MKNASEHQREELYFSALEMYKAFNLRDDNNAKIHSRGKAQLLSFSSLVHAAQDPSHPTATNTMKIINASLYLRSQYHKIVKLISFAYSGNQVAASSDAFVSKRQGENFELIIDNSVSKEKQDNITVSLRTTDPAFQSSSFVHLHCFINDSILPIIMNKVADGLFRMDCKRHSSEHNVIRDVNCEIFIR